MKILLLVLFSACFAQATDTSTSSVSYDLRQLKPIGLSQYASPGSASVRLYLKFQNEAGTHYFLYEENPEYPALKDVNALQQALASPDFSCEAEVSCPSKAFCTGDCRHMYYELSNVPPPAPFGENRCRILTFHCDRPGARGIASAPAAAQAVASVSSTIDKTPPSAEASHGK